MSFYFTPLGPSSSCQSFRFYGNDAVNAAQKVPCVHISPSCHSYRLAHEKAKIPNGQVNGFSSLFLSAAVVHVLCHGNILFACKASNEDN